MFVPGHNAVLRGGFWTDDWVKLELNDQVVVFADDTGLVTTDLLYLRRPDRPFHGLGAATTQDDETFYRVEQVEARVGLSGKLGQLNRTTLQLAYRHTSFEDGQSPPISERFATAEVPGFGGYDLVSTRLGLELDSRGPDRRYSTGSGLRLELFGSFNVDPTEIDLNFFHWGAEAAGFLDLTGANHVLGLRAYTHFVENTGDLAVPFTEQAELGGRRLMRGFLEGRFRGPSAFVVTGEYRYPIWALVDASLFISAGNAFDEHLKDLHVKKLFLSGGLGIRTNTRRNLSFDALLAFGSSRLDQEDVTLEHVHFVFGVNSGF
jgi:outer membrane protein assembly factor BamA